MKNGVTLNQGVFLKKQRCFKGDLQPCPNWYYILGVCIYKDKQKNIYIHIPPDMHISSCYMDRIYIYNFNEIEYIYI